jgi:hypothetical protein
MTHGKHKSLISLHNMAVPNCNILIANPWSILPSARMTNPYRPRRG